MKLKRGYCDGNGNRFWYYKKGKEVWIKSELFTIRRDALLLRLKLKRETDHDWRDDQNYKTKIRNSKPDVALYKLERKRILYAQCPERRNRISIKNAESRMRLTPDERRRRLDKNLSYCKDRYQNDALFNISVRVRRRIGVFLKGRGLDKRTKTRQMVGCDTAQLKAHLESLFTVGMTWENKNQWHIDHIIPLASAVSEDDVIRLCHYTNLQPLWALDNLRKGSKIKQPKQCQA